MNNGWYVVYILMCALNGILYGTMGNTINSWQFWVSPIIPILCFLAGRNYY